MTAPSRTRFRVVACVLALAMVQLATIGEGLRYALAGLADFRAFYAAGHIVRTGQAANLYDYDLQHTVQNTRIGGRTAALPFVYPVYAAAPFAPLSYLRYKTAFYALLALNLALLALAVWVMLPWLAPLRTLWPPLPWLLFACFYPVGIALVQGQVSLFLLLIFCLCFASLQRGRDAMAGTLLALALMKFHVVLPIVLLFCIWRRWRFVAGFFAGAIAVFAACLGIAGVLGMKNYIHAMTVAAKTGAVGVTRDAYQVFSAKMPNLHGLTFALARDARWGTILLAVLSISVLAWTARSGPSFPRAIVAALLVSYHLHLHDLSLLLLPLALILSAGLERKIRWPILATALLWMLSPLLTWMSGLGLNWAMTLLMLPLLLPWEGSVDDVTQQRSVILSEV
jgi:hypothetical protein